MQRNFESLNFKKFSVKSNTRIEEKRLLLCWVKIKMASKFRKKTSLIFCFIHGFYQLRGKWKLVLYLWILFDSIMMDARFGLSGILKIRHLEGSLINYRVIDSLSENIISSHLIPIKVLSNTDAELAALFRRGRHGISGCFGTIKFSLRMNCKIF